MNSQNNTAFITRFHYPENTLSWRWRLDFYSDEVLPRILAQADSGFDIWVWCEPWQDNTIKSLSPRIRTFTGKWEPRSGPYFVDFTEYGDLKNLPKYQIQIGLDSDDLIEPGFVERVHQLCKGNKSIFVSFQPYKLNISTGQKYEFAPNWKYKKRNLGSPIFAFYQPNLDHRFKFLYHASHLVMPNFANVHIIEPEGLASMGIHHLNDSTTIEPGDLLCM